MGFSLIGSVNTEKRKEVISVIIIQYNFNTFPAKLNFMTNHCVLRNFGQRRKSVKILLPCINCYTLAQSQSFSLREIKESRF